MRMRASFPRQPPGPLSRSAVRNAALLNQCATPGLGSFIAGRRVAGIGQLLLAAVGFALFVAWFVLRMIQLYNQVINDLEPKPVGWVGEVGVAVFAVAWFWSLVTSLSLLREVRAAEPPAAPKPAA